MTSLQLNGMKTSFMFRYLQGEDISRDLKIIGVENEIIRAELMGILTALRPQIIHKEAEVDLLERAEFENEYLCSISEEEEYSYMQLYKEEQDELLREFATVIGKIYYTKDCEWFVWTI